MDELCERVLNLLNVCAPLNTLQISHELKEDHQKIIGTIKKIEAFGNVIKTTQLTNKRWDLTEEGKNVVQNGSHEALIFHAIPPDGISQANLMKKVESPNAKVGFSKAMSFGWIKLDKKAQNGPMVFRQVEEIHDNVRELLQKIESLQINEVPDNQKQDLKKRKLLQEVVEKYFLVEKGLNFSTQLIKEEKDLTPEMISTGSWREKKFVKCNFDAMGVPPDTGYLHPLLKVRSEFKRIFIEMGFTEMPTNKYVESSFWNFDALFQPQHHPARDLQDTFFTSDPRLSSDFPQEYLERVKEVHSKGGYGSEGYHSDWKLEEAQKNVLRTHTTAVSARMLYKLAQQMADAKDPYSLLPVKYFSIDRVFRNETLDATHLAEFHQIEGVVAGRGFTLGNLMGILQQFFSRLGITQLQFKPAYNPYTEPSMEVFGFHSGLNKWVEVGNSGMFRPEMLRPMGLPDDVSVLGYGLSLERPTMIKYGLSNIRELVGHKVNLKMVQEFPLCRLDK